MDLSKLPKLSDSSQSPPPTSSTPESPASSAPTPVAPAARPRPNTNPPAGADVWLSIAIGALLLFLFPRLLQYLSSVVFHTEFAPYTMPDGTVVPYTSTHDFASDLAVTAYALVLLLDGLVLAWSRNRALVMIAFVFTCLATLGNLIFFAATFSTYGIPIVSGFAIVFGIYIAISQWQTLQQS